MATADSVKAKIQGLIDTANAKTGKNDTELTSAVNNLCEGYGSGGGSGIIDVTELPTENIIEDTIYRVTNQTAEIWFKSADFGCVKAEEFLSNMSGTQFAFKIHLVDTLPQEIPVPDMNTLAFYVYVLKDTGISYTNMGQGTMPLSAMFGVTDYGWTEDVNAETEDGLYTVALTTQDRYVYLNKEWVKIEAPVEPLKYTLSDDGTYYIVSANAKTEIGHILIPSMYNALPVKEIATEGFAYCYFSSVAVYSSITKIGDGAFHNCPLLKNVMFEDVNSIEFGENVFEGCIALDSISELLTATKIPSGAFKDCVSLWQWSVPNTLTEIGSSAFEGCSSLISSCILDDIEAGTGNGYARICFPASVKKIDEAVFDGCYGISEIHFLGIPDTVSVNAFVGMSNVKDIYVPWAEGTVANAPWGAPSTATIHYNYVEET